MRVLEIVPAAFPFLSLVLAVMTRSLFLALLAVLCVHGCAVVTVAGAVVSVAATAVSVTATVVETTVDVAAAGVDAVIDDDDEDARNED